MNTKEGEQFPSQQNQSSIRKIIQNLEIEQKEWDHIFFQCQKKLKETKECLGNWLENISGKGPDSKYFQFCGP